MEEIVQRPILAIHPPEGRALTVSRPAERRPMSLSGSLRPGQAEAGWEEKQGHCYRIVLFAGATGLACKGPQHPGIIPLMPVTMRFDWRLEHPD
ncbi:hypothetical protein PFLUV_G00053570 [Perca fluviatilis]|uniref:Uncharacterized protein n=1 Tax=Perca fluviatilis TaxID=8168 RepID=A0A6A5FG90_PERFL|nr:hypothetical protein PFLUV_G00053570 [Perca fluviatilis]